MRAFESIVEEHGACVFSVCRAVIGPVDAEDAWSETFLAALTAYPRLVPGSNVRAWLVTIAHRKVIDVARSKSRLVLPISGLPERPSSLGIADAGDGELWAAVAALPERQRFAIAYHYLGGLPHAETAELIGGSVESIRRAVSDGVASLRKVYPSTLERGTS